MNANFSKTSFPIVKVVIDRPMKDPFDYFWDRDAIRCKPEVGMIVEIPFGKGSTIGLVTKTDTTSELSAAQIKFVKRAAPLQPIDIRVMDLAKFASHYYLYGLGETILPSIPKWWRTPMNWEKFKGELKATTKSPPLLENQEKVIGLDELNEEQNQILELRKSARAQGNFAESDRLRDLLKSQGIEVRDNLDGQSWSWLIQG